MKVSMKRLSALALLLAAATCTYDPAATASIEAARTVTRDYARQELQAFAAGTDCLVLLVRAAAALDDAAVETLHYGDGESTPYPGGLQQFAERRKFRAVAYQDSTGRLWTYGSITRQEAQSLPVCR